MGRRVQRTSSQDLKHIILGPTKGKYYRPTEVCDEVYPGILLGEASTALSTCLLKELKVTHVLNAAHGKNDRYNYGFVNTSHANYQQAGIKFMGIPAMDCPSYYLRTHFQEAADYIDDALRSGGKVLVHCLAGISRSATLVAAFLMIKKGMGVEEALSTIRSRRNIYPNDGFLRQLSDFDYALQRKANSSSNRSELETTAVSESKKSYGSQKPISETITVREAYKPENSGGSEEEMTLKGYIQNRPITKNGYPLTSVAYDIATKSRSRARSEDRFSRPYYEYNYRARSVSPIPSYFDRECSVMPEPEMYQYRVREKSIVPKYTYLGSKYGTSPIIDSYESGKQQRVYYQSRTRNEPILYTGRLPSRPITLTYLKSMYPANQDSNGSLSRTLTPRNNSSLSASPFESYTSFSSPYTMRSYTTYKRNDGPRSRIQQGLNPHLKYPAYYPATYRHAGLSPLKVY